MNPAPAWLLIDQRAEQLHCSARNIYQLKADKVFTGGIHFYVIGKGSIRGKCVYNLEACRQTLLERTQKLKQRQSIKRSETYDETHLNELISKGG